MKKEINKFAVYILYFSGDREFFLEGFILPQFFFLFLGCFFVFDCLYEFAFSYRSKDYVKTLIITIILILSIVIIVFFCINIFDLGCNRGGTTKSSNAICPKESCNSEGICNCIYINEHAEEEIIHCPEHFSEKNNNFL